ncbi:MAG: GAF domain-containing protein [Bdellovibrionota bacterium]
MSGSIAISKNLTKAAIYAELHPQLAAILEGETDPIACLGNFSAALKEVFGFLWIGFYLVRGEELVLGPFQGPVACTRIARRRGVCGTAWDEARTLVVDDVDAFPGHIACSSISRSEIVVPLKTIHGQVWGVLDIDSEKLASFDTVDQTALEELIRLLPHI